MEIEVIPNEAVAMKLQKPVDHGYTTNLYDRRPGSRNRRERRSYTCRHCLDATKANIAGKNKSPSKLLTFDGLRAHAKSRFVQLVNAVDFVAH